MEPQTGPSRIYVVLFFCLAAAGVGWLAFRVLVPFFAAIAWAIVLAVAFNRPWRWLAARLPRRPGAAAALLTTVIALVVLVPAGLFVGLLAAQATEQATAVANLLRDRNISSFSDVVELPWVSSLLDQLQSRAGISPEDFQSKVGEIMAGASAMLANLSGKMVLGIFDALLTFFTTLFLLFFAFRDGDAMVAALLEVLPSGEGGRLALRDSLHGMLTSIFRGSLLCALVQGATGGIGWAIAGLESPALAGAAMAVLSLLPLGGTALVWLPGTAWAWSRGHHGGAIFLFIWGLVVVSFVADNVLKPMLIGGTRELSTLVVFLGVFGGLAAFGLLGIFIGPIVLVLAVSLLEVLRREATPDAAVAAVDEATAEP